MVSIRKMDMLYFCTLAVGFYSFASATLKINELIVPQSVEYGSTNEIIMDCVFEASNETDLEVKWFFNGNIEQIYQWIPGSSQGFAMNRLKDRVDLTYAVSNDNNTKYRALRITNITQDLTGNYTCKVSSFDHEVARTKQLIVYSPAKIPLEIILFEKESFVICTTGGIFPEPEVDFYLEKKNGSQQDINEDIDTDSDGEGYFNVTAKHRFDNYTLDGPTTFVCNVSVAGTDYYISKTLEYLKDTDNSAEVSDEYSVIISDTHKPSATITFTANCGNAHTSSVLSLLLLLPLMILSTK